MESYLKENFGGVKAKHSSDEALGRWRRLVGVVKNPKRRFRFTANLDKRSEAAAMKRSNQVTAAAFNADICYVRVLHRRRNCHCHCHRFSWHTSDV
jgi:hypothetical protein